MPLLPWYIEAGLRPLLDASLNFRGPEELSYPPAGTVANPRKSQNYGCSIGEVHRRF